MSFHISTNHLLARRVRRNQHNLAIIDKIEHFKILGQMGGEERSGGMFVDKVYLGY